MSAKKKQKLMPVLKPQKAKAAKADVARGAARAPSGESAPDLSHIAEGLRSLAVPIGTIEFDPANARKHGEDNVKGIRASLRMYGQRRPLVVNRRTNTVEAGNGCLAAALELGWEHIAVVFVDDDRTAAAGYAIADNRTAELADWDKEALDALLRTVQSGDQDLAEMFEHLAEAERLIPAEPKAPKDIAFQAGEKKVKCPQCGHEFALEANDGRSRMQGT